MGNVGYAMRQSIGLKSYRITTNFCEDYIYAVFASCNPVAKIRSQ